MKNCYVNFLSIINHFIYNDNYFLVPIICLIEVCGTLAQRPECSMKKDSGDGKDSVQKFYWNDKWHMCFGFKYSGKGGNGNKFNSFGECMGGCAMADGSMCSGPSPSKSPLNEGHDCDTAKCPKGYKCAFGMHAECCEEKEYDAKQAAFEEKCPDGSKAGGSNDKGYFEAIFGETCNDLVCKKDQKCVQINKHFAKCCGGK